MNVQIKLAECLIKLEALITKINLSQKKVFTLQEAAAYSGLSESFLYKLTSNGLIPHYKPEKKRIYFDREELEAWLLRNPVRTAESIEANAATYVTLNRKSA
ncbi:helix-turn-helix domain-containing protein [Pontibacter liquoris]|uniref:helix-turn-helix domain-containing protein n=1 Tax=Pontibacter liquoris TaxID=2905677 RepID=UPI001FA79281|nr:helix-turn-helix domain-containing protein [Pontibacter liquoris]